MPLGTDCIKNAIDTSQDIEAIKISLTKNTYDASSNLLVSQATALSSTIDSIDVNKMSSGGIVTALSAITATTTSAEIDCRGFNSVRIEAEVTAINGHTCALTITGSEVSGGTFGQIFKDIAGTQTVVALPSLTAIKKEIYIIQGGIPNYIKLTETLSGGTSATVTVKVTPFNV